MKRAGWLAIGAPGLAGTAIAAVVARREFTGRVDGLEASLEQAQSAAGTRSDIPSEVLDLSRRLGASDDRAARIVRLNQRGEMRL